MWFLIYRSSTYSIYTVRNTDDPHYGAGIPKGEDMYEVSGFIVRFFSRETMELLSDGYTIVEVDEFEEGDLPRNFSK